MTSLTRIAYGSRRSAPRQVARVLAEPGRKQLLHGAAAYASPRPPQAGRGRRPTPRGPARIPRPDPRPQRGQRWRTTTQGLISRFRTETLASTTPICSRSRAAAHGEVGPGDRRAPVLRNRSAGSDDEGAFRARGDLRAQDRHERRRRCRRGLSHAVLGGERSAVRDGSPCRGRRRSRHRRGRRRRRVGRARLDRPRRAGHGERRLPVLRRLAQRSVLLRCRRRAERLPVHRQRLLRRQGRVQHRVRAAERSARSVGRSRALAPDSRARRQRGRRMGAGRPRRKAVAVRLLLPRRREGRLPRRRAGDRRALRRQLRSRRSSTQAAIPRRTRGASPRRCCPTSSRTTRRSRPSTRRTAAR